MSPRFSVIMPFYNAASTIRRSLESLTVQTVKDFELVAVDDCSTDSSADAVKAFATENNLKLKIVRQSRNGGVAAARNAGLDAAEGEYIMWLDADDALEPQAFEKVAQYDADIIGFDWTLGARHMRQRDYDSPLQALRNLMGGTMRWNLWTFAFKRELVACTRFTIGADMGEDMAFTITAFCKANDVVQIHDALYTYTAPADNSVSQKLDEARRDQISANLETVLQAIREFQFASELVPYENHLKLFLKLPLLISATGDDYKVWYSWWPESNISATANRDLPLHTRALQWAAAHKLWLLVSLYSKFALRLVYRLIYKK